MARSGVITNSSSAAISGVNVAGYLSAESGVGAAARGYVTALQEAGLEVALNNFEVAVQSRKEDRSYNAYANNNPYPVNLICVNADQIPAFVSKFGDSYFEGKYNIGVWWWELPDFPEAWLESFTRFDEIWVGSTFIQQSLTRVSPVPVIRIPPVVDAQLTKKVNRADFGLSDDEYTFLFMFDSLSSIERKNPAGVVRAFQMAFNPTEKVRLALKCINLNGEKADALKSAFGNANITLIDRYLSREENLGLIDACDCYISLHRSEGLGLPLAEAMLLGKPAIATAWSGNVDFMSVANSYPVSYRLVLNETECGPYKVGEMWAEADVEHASRLMREVHQGIDLVKTSRAKQDVASEFSAQSLATLIRSRLQSIRAFSPNLLDSSSTHQTKGDYYLDETVKLQLDIIETGSSPLSSKTQAEASKSLLRRVLMPIVERAGYLGSIYSQLFKRLFLDMARCRTQIDIVDARTRKSLAEADRRIRELEATIAEWKKSSKDDLE